MITETVYRRKPNGRYEAIGALPRPSKPTLEQEIADLDEEVKLLRQIVGMAREWCECGAIKIVEAAFCKGTRWDKSKGGA